MERIYKPLEELSDEEIEEVLREGELDELILLPLSIGQYHSNWMFSKYLYEII